MDNTVEVRNCKLECCDKPELVRVLKKNSTKFICTNCFAVFYLEHGEIQGEKQDERQDGNAR